MDKIFHVYFGFPFHGPAQDVPVIQTQILTLVHMAHIYVMLYLAENAMKREATEVFHVAVDPPCYKRSGISTSAQDYGRVKCCIDFSATCFVVLPLGLRLHSALYLTISLEGSAGFCHLRVISIMATGSGFQH